MDRLIHLKTSELNYSTSSELGYETANEYSQSSLYYSINDTLDETLEANVESLNQSIRPLIALQNTLTVPTTTNQSIHSNSSVESSENVANSVPVSNKSRNLSENLSNSAAISENSIEPTENLVMSDSVLSNNVIYIDNQTNVEPQLKVDITSLDYEINQCSNSVTVNQNNMLAMKTQQDTTEVSVSEHATGLTLQSTSMITRGPKTRQTLVRFHSADEPDAFIPQKTTSNTHREVLSSWNSLSRRSIFPKPILKKTVSFDQPIKKTVRLTVYDVQKNYSRPQTRSSIVRKSMPRQSISGVAGASGVAASSGVATSSGATGSSGLTRKGSNICDICNKAFLLKSTLMTHKLQHKDETSQTNCKYCDRSFKKPIALSMHLKENCEKIPAAARKKILASIN